jgi:hypothetical protein
LFAGGAWKPGPVPALFTGPEISNARRASRLVPVWPRPNERWLSEKRGRKGSPELLLDRRRIRFKEKVELEEGVEAAGEGCGPAEGDGIEYGESTGGGEVTDGGGGTGGGDLAGGGDEAGGGVLPADADVLLAGDT